MLRRIHDPDRGATMLEYCAVLILAAAVLGSLLSSGLLGAVRTATTSALEALLQPGPPPAASGGPDAGQPSEPDVGARPTAGPEGGGAGDGTPEASGNGGGGSSGRTIKAEPRTPTTDAGWMAEFGDTVGIQFEESAENLAGEAVDAWAGPGKYLKDTGQGAVDGTVDTLKSWRQDGKDNSEKSALETRDVHEKYGGWAAAGYSMYAGQRDMWWTNESSAGGFARRGAGGVFDGEFWEATERSETGAEPAAIAAYNGLGYVNPLEAKGKWLDLLGTPSAKPKGPGPKPDPRADGGGKPGATDPPDKGRDEEDRDDEGDDPDGPSCPTKNSFVPGTPVLLADGSTEPIEDIEVGDEVHAFDPRTGEEGPRPVTHLIEGEGKKTLVKITVTDENGKTGSVTATDEHPFWVPDKAEWVDAIDLTPGSLLRTSAGSWARVSSASTTETAESKVHNFSVSGPQTYFVVPGSTSILVHNCRPGAGRELIGGQEQYHIISGDKKGGGHKWPGQPGKTVFPEDWDTDRILDGVAEVATSPNSNWKQQTGSAGSDYTRRGNPSRWRVEGVVDGVNIRVIYEPANNRIVTGFPVGS